jgi:hypothetical protein
VKVNDLEAIRKKYGVLLTGDSEDSSQFVDTTTKAMK